MAGRLLGIMDDGKVYQPYKRAREYARAAAGVYSAAGAAAFQRAALGSSLYIHAPILF